MADPADAAGRVARDIFGLDGAITPLPGEFDLNFKVSGPAETIVLKLVPAARRPVFELVTACLDHLEHVRLPAPIPRIVRPRADDHDRPYVEVDLGGSPFLASAVTYLEGQPLAGVRPRPLKALSSLGELLAHIQRGLADFECPGLDRAFPWRLETTHDVVARHLEDVDPDRRHLVSATVTRANLHLGPLRDHLPATVLHNDANDYNVLVRPGLRATRLAGLIDFGDVVRGWRVADPVVAAAYAMMGLDDPVEAACAVANGYASVCSLKDAECAAFIPLVALRLCLSVSIQATQMRDQPDNDYLSVSQAPAWSLLEELAGMDWRIAMFRIREACGLVPNPHREPVMSWTRSQPTTPVLPDECLERPVGVDLSVASPLLPADPAAGSPDSLEGAIERHVNEAGATVGVGRYGEPRTLYGGDGFVVSTNDGPEARTIHLGVDLFAPVGTAVRTPLPGTIRSVADNALHLDYGPTVIVEHLTGDGLPFFTLYGHLDANTLSRTRPGEPVAEGDVVGWLGDASVNGGWPPHLHFQVIALPELRDPGLPSGPAAGRAIGDGNFPGVAAPSMQSVWEDILPDPTELAGLSGDASEPGIHRSPSPQSAAGRIRESRSLRLGPSLSLSYDRPLHIVRGRGQYLFDYAGRRYLDTVNNVAHVGHANRRVNEAIARQASVLNTNTRYLHDEIVALAEELVATMPSALEVVYFVCSGSEANELALRMARCHTGREPVVALEGGYHGNTRATLQVSPYKFMGPGGAGASDAVAVVPMPDPYRGLYRWGEAEGDPGARYVDLVRRALAELPHGAAAFLAEPILSCGGQIEPPPGFLSGAYAAAREAGAVCIADEVQVGFGRVGDRFWGFELDGAVPDIVTLGKPMGNGHPVGAVVTTRVIADSFANGMEYFNTFGGNPVSCAAGRAVLAEIDQEGLQERARSVGSTLKEGLRHLQGASPLIGDVRGRGLFLGVELVRDRDSREPHPAAASYVVNRMRTRGFLMSSDGPDRNVLKIKPPLVFEDADALALVGALGHVLAETALQATEA